MTNEILSIISNSNRIVIAGAGKVGTLLADEIKFYQPDIDIVFCDNNKAKHGTFTEYSITSMEFAVKSYTHEIFFVASKSFANRIKKQLLQLGIDEKQIVCEQLVKELVDLESQNEEKTSLTPVKYLRFEIPLAEHCNLNCKWCAHFSSVAEESYLSMEQLKKDLKRLSYLLSGKSGIIYLLGGEPLLSKNIIECMELAREYFHESRIVLLTNGILLAHMEDEFWASCKGNNIVLQITKYPINIDYDGLVKKIESKGIECDFFRLSDEECLMNRLPMDLSGGKDAYDSFTHCYMANRCVSLKNKRLYTCPVIANIEHFNKYFHQKLDVCEGDYIDIYKVKSANEIFEALATPVPFCRYCDVQARTKGHRWEVSKKTIDEWVTYRS